MTTNMAGHCTQTQVRYMTLPLGLSATLRISALIGSSGLLLLSDWLMSMSVGDLMNTKAVALLAGGPLPVGSVTRHGSRVTSLSWPRKNCICAPDMTAAIRFSSTFYICHPSQALALSSLNIKPLNNN